MLKTKNASKVLKDRVIDSQLVDMMSQNKRIKLSESMASENKVDVLMMGTGEYTTGYVGGQASDSDKGAGVVALTMFDLRRRNKVDRVAMCGVNVR